MFADEPHAYPDSALYDVVSEGMAHRDQGIAFLLSTSGYNKQGFYYKKLQYAKQVMAGIIHDPSIYLMCFELDEKDDWTDEKLWKKRILLLVLVSRWIILETSFIKRKHSASDEVSFKTKHLDLWVDSAITWIRNKDWMASNMKVVD